MRQIQAFSCSHCDKIYSKKDSCRSHEYRCYFNPRTRSCASCWFLRHEDYEYASLHHVSLRSCLKNHDLTRRMKTSCVNFHSKGIGLDRETFAELKRNYDPLPYLQPILDRMKAKNEEDVRKQKEQEELVYTLQAEAIIGLLGSAVGYTILLQQEVALMPTESNDDEALERHFDSRQYVVEIVLSWLEKLGIEPKITNHVINDISAMFSKEILLYAPLCRQGEIVYHQNMRQVAILNEDSEGESFFKDIVDQLNSVTTTGLIGNFVLNSVNSFTNNTPDLKSFDLFCRILHDIYPDFKKKIMDGIKNPIESNFDFESPF